MTIAQKLDERYGRVRGRRWPWIAAGAVASALVIAYAWMTVAASMSAVDSDALGFQVVDEHSVVLSFQVSGHAHADLSCALEALDEEFGVVGWRIVEIPADGTPARALTERIPTVAEATTGLVKACWVA